MKINRVLVPMIRAELLQLRSWIFYCPPPGVRDVVLQIAIDTQWGDREKESVTRLFRASALHEHGWALEFLDCGMTAEESFYIKDAKKKIDIERFPYGQKSGPNMQFFRSMRKVMAGPSGAQAVLLMEVDAFPVVDDWLARLQARIDPMADGRPLVAGATYAGTSRLSDQIRAHLNGNSIYFVGDADFGQFLDDWEYLLLAGLKTVPFLAYDVAIHWYVNYRKTHPAVSKLADSRTARLEEKFLPRLHPIPDVLVNYGGPDENDKAYRLDVVAFRRRHPAGCIAHGKCFFGTIHRLRLAYRYPNRQVELNLVHDALREGRLEDALLAGIDDIAIVNLVSHRVACAPRSSFNRLSA